jgi:hypothetical protein
MKHPGKTPAQRRALDEIGCGNYCPSMTNATRDKLLASGLIVELNPVVIGRDRFGEIAIPQYEMPILVHYQWCKAMSAEPPADQSSGMPKGGEL